jgi:CBS-domain-containing membrane protein
MTRRILSCSVDDDVNVAINKMETKKVRRLPVLDGHKALAGMLSLGDISCEVTRQTFGESVARRLRTSRLVASFARRKGRAS